MSSRSDGGKVVASTVLPSQILIVCEEEGENNKDGEAPKAIRVPRFTLGRENLALQGFPIDDVVALVDNQFSKLREGLLSDLAGNAVSTPVFLAMLMATMASVTWQVHELHEVHEGDGDDDVDGDATITEAADDALMDAADEETDGTAGALAPVREIGTGPGLLQIFYGIPALSLIHI